MGEYAKFDGKEVKIGTCENMYYLRADQALRVRPLSGNVNPVRDCDGIRFRFPWPDEDRNEPGSYSDPFRSLGLYDVAVPEGVEHNKVQFGSNHPTGTLVMLPCPESPEGAEFARTNGLRWMRNGYPGPVKIVQQRVWEGRLVLVCECGGCGSKYRLPTLEEARPVVDRLLAYAEAAERSDRTDARVEMYREVARRIVAGYTDPLPWNVNRASVEAR